MEWVLSFSDNTIPHFPYTFNKNFITVKREESRIEVHFSDTSDQNVENRLKRVILHDLAQCESCSHGKRDSQGKSDEK